MISISGGIEPRSKMPFSACELKTALEAMLEQAPAGSSGSGDKVALELALMTDEEISALNQQYLNCSGPTNILSFPAPKGHASVAGTPETLGWMALSVDALRREAVIYRQDLTEYSLSLLAHGLAHLCGYEHGEDMDTLAKKATSAAKARLTGV